MKKLIKNQLWLMVLCIFSLPASAYDFEVDGIEYTITSTADFKCEVSGSSNKLEVLEIPEKVSYMNRELKVIAIGKNAFASRDINKIILPETIKSLKSGCFQNSSIKTIENSNSVTFFGEYCFKDCKNLEKIKFNQNEKVTLGQGCFSGCSSLENLDIPSSVLFDEIGNSSFSECSGLQEVIINCQSLPMGSFSGCTSLTTVCIGENCYSLGRRCFSGCISLFNINIPSSITHICEECFSGCSSLKSIKIPESVKVKSREKPTAFGDLDGNGMFVDCTSLESVEWNADVIPLYAFKGCSALNTVTIGGNTNEIYLGSIPALGNSHTPNFTFDGCNIKSLKILQGESDIDLYFMEVGSNWSNFHNSLIGYQDDLLQIFDKIEELYIARNINSLSNMKTGTQYNNLKKIIIGDNSPYYVTSNLGARFDWSNLEYLRSERIEPPYLPNSFTTQQYTTMNVEVPTEALELYQIASVWKNFWNINGFDGIEDIFIDGKNFPVKVFNLSGFKIGDSIDNLGPGIYIIKQGTKTYKISIN